MLQSASCSANLIEFKRAPQHPFLDCFEVLKREIFGPIIPILAVSSVDEVYCWWKRLGPLPTPALLESARLLESSTVSGRSRWLHTATRRLDTGHRLGASQDEISDKYKGYKGDVKSSPHSWSWKFTACCLNPCKCVQLSLVFFSLELHLPYRRMQRVLTWRVATGSLWLGLFLIVFALLMMRFIFWEANIHMQIR